MTSRTHFVHSPAFGRYRLPLISDENAADSEQRNRDNQMHEQISLFKLWIFELHVSREHFMNYESR